MKNLHITFNSLIYTIIFLISFFYLVNHSEAQNQQIILGDPELLKDIQKEIEDCERIVASHPNDIPALLRLAKAYGRECDEMGPFECIDKMRDAYLKVLTIDDKNCVALKGMVYVQRNSAPRDYQKLLSYSEKALSLEHCSQEREWLLQVSGETFVNIGQFDKAIIRLEEIHLKKPSYYTEVFLAYAYLASRNFEKVIELRRDIEDKNYRCDKRDLYLGIAYSETGNAALAKHYLERGKKWLLSGRTKWSSGPVYGKEKMRIVEGYLGRDYTQKDPELFSKAVATFHPYVGTGDD